ncbi:ATP-binding cassette domain-containing protein [Histidinibacterium aquaticum]|uniref:Metal ABC transporter ATP-binding protein n=1 Tax=Histidinibacterium aquaticum TaxID=2613962 RepID=A0A5J5GQR1_9RHOB|nr:metal ABC transporter ATP-binding protein [Histidinibacterium aquaticum]KAA9010676.1 metal ABC transporter ATP-binding protein [Histidinibacterium aquaticum]
MKGLSVSFGANRVLDSVDFRIDRGEIVTVVGPNGSGKSTLLHALIGGVRPSTGSVRRAPGLRVGYVPQKLSLDATLPMTVRRFLGLPRRVSRETAQVALDHAGVPGVGRLQMSALSGGQFQRVLLARAILESPDLLILDEATAGLDQPGAAAFYRRIEEVRKETGCAVLMVSHDLHVVMSASDRVICLNGHICCEGTPEVVAEAPVYRALFGEGTKGALALYRHHHDHHHGPAHGHSHDGPTEQTRKAAADA